MNKYLSQFVKRKHDVEWSGSSALYYDLIETMKKEGVDLSASKYEESCRFDTSNFYNCRYIRVGNAFQGSGICKKTNKAHRVAWVIYEVKNME